MPRSPRASPPSASGRPTAIYWRSAPRLEEWFLIEWPAGESEPAKYWLSTLPADTPLGDLVDRAKLRWRIERDYQELKQEVGLCRGRPPINRMTPQSGANS